MYCCNSLFLLALTTLGISLSVISSLSAPRDFYPASSDFLLSALAKTLVSVEWIREETAVFRVADVLPLCYPCLVPTLNSKLCENFAMCIVCIF